MGIVSIVRTDKGIKSSLVEALEFIGGLAKHVGRSDRVMIKPNLNGTEGFTSRELTESLLQLLSDYGAGSVVIAESTFGNERITDMCFEQTGYRSLAEKYGVSLINLNRSQAIEVKVGNPLVLERLKIAREVFEADKIINLPVMKVHYATGITLAMKNLKGLLTLNEKRRFHEAGLDKAIADLNAAIKPTLNIVDCISCMERMGPRGGDAVNLNLLLAGDDRAEVDYIGAQIMGYAPEEVKHLKYYIEASGIDLKAVEAVGERIEAVRYPFKKVKMETIIPGNFRIHDKNACSSCMNALLLSCQLMDKMPTGAVDVYLGSKAERDAQAQGLAVAFGNCCCYDLGCDIKIKGCPPYPFDLKEAVSGWSASSHE